MPQYGRYTPWVSSKARIDAEANDRHLGGNPFRAGMLLLYLPQRPQVQGVGCSNLRERQEDKARILLPSAKHRSVHYEPGEPSTYKLRSKLRKSNPDAQSSLSATRATKGLNRSKNVKVFQPPIHKSLSTPNVQSSDSVDHSYKRGKLAQQLSPGPQALTRMPPNITRQPPIPRHNFRLCSDTLTEPERPSTTVLPLYSTSIKAPIPGVTAIVPVSGVVSPESADTQTMSPVASTRPALPPVRTRPLPPIPKPFAVSPPVNSKDISCGTHPACPPARQRRQAPPVSMDEVDYREVITAFLENDNPAFHDCPGMVDWTLQQDDPSSGAESTSFIWIE